MRMSHVLRFLAVLLMVVAVGAAACSGKKKPAASGAPGVTATEVKLGTHTSLTGPLAAYNIIPKFTLAYFNYINDTQNGVNGRKINYIEKDDQYSPAQAVDLTRQLVEQEGIFAMFNALGTPNHLQVIDYLQQRGVPDMYVATGATEWVKDPSKRPLVFGSTPNYTGEGVAIGTYIADNFSGKKVGVVYQNDDFGQDGLAGLRLGVGSYVNVVAAEPYEVTDTDLNSQIDRLKSDGADVVAMWATPLLVGNGIKQARRDLNWKAPFFISSVSMNELTSAITGGADGCGVNSGVQGCLIDGTMGPAATYMGYETSNDGVAKHLQLLQSTGLAQKANVLTLYAQAVSELMVETLKKAQEPLTRDSLVRAAESIKNWKCSICLFPGTLGADDHDPSQTVAMAKYQGGQVVITDKAYSWEGVKVAELSRDTLREVAVPADALATP